jgi:hypothetical protein
MSMVLGRVLGAQGLDVASFKPAHREPSQAGHGRIAPSAHSPPRPGPMGKVHSFNLSRSSTTVLTLNAHNQYRETPTSAFPELILICITFSFS